jgi:biopolymer transport protein ExbB/TolQ
MTTQLAFAFGMLVAVSIAMVIGIVVSLVKVIRLEAKVKEVNRDIHNSIDIVRRHLNQIEGNLNRRIDDAEMHISREMDNQTGGIHRRIDETHRQFNINEEEMRRMIDSRFDKFENKMRNSVPITIEPDMAGIDLVIEKTKGKKQLLKD